MCRVLCALSCYYDLIIIIELFTCVFQYFMTNYPRLNLNILMFLLFVFGFDSFKLTFSKFFQSRRKSSKRPFNTRLKNIVHLS